MTVPLPADCLWVQLRSGEQQTRGVGFEGESCSYCGRQDGNRAHRTEIELSAKISPSSSDIHNTVVYPPQLTSNDSNDEGACLNLWMAEVSSVWKNSILSFPIPMF